MRVLWRTYVYTVSLGNGLGLSSTQENHMSFAVTRRTLGALAVLGASACTLGMAASAQAVTITSPVINSGYSNNSSPVITFSGAVPGDTVTVTSSNDTVLGGDGSATADGSGDG